ncbi:unnamed protein product [Somion occarium]|uniref:DUF6533 domain-containing protein n=1 Tax=Somion occarium TaxID=3059160 RepID=A0ABP1CWM0_9APHY
MSDNSTDLQDVYDLSPDDINSVAWGIILSALILYHHFTTIPQEINTLWTRKRSLASLIFFVNRYALLLVGAEYMAQIFPVYGDVLVDRRCDITSTIGGVALCIVMIAVIAFDTLRVFAITQRSYLASAFVGTLGVTWVVLYWVLPDIEGVTITFSNAAFLGCQNYTTIATNYDAILRWNYGKDAATILFEATVLAFTLLKTFRLKKEASAIGFQVSLASLLIQDGALQFGIILLISILDIVLLGTTGNPVPMIIPKSIITSNIFFHLRQVYPESEVSQSTSSFTVSNLRFASNIIGNMGAPLHNIFTDSHEEIEAEADNIQFATDPLATCLDTIAKSQQTGRSLSSYSTDIELTSCLP